MQDIPQETLSETTKAEQSAKVDLWEFDLTAIGGERFFFCNEPNEKGEPLPAHHWRRKAVLLPEQQPPEQKRPQNGQKISRT